MHVFDIVTGLYKYLNWQYTWWSGTYTIMLTKAALIHRDYLPHYYKIIPKDMLDHIDQNRNCEDLSMAYVVANLVKTNKNDSILTYLFCHIR
jgi:hypothetical protein